ncbi:rhomboid family intramembrane serine protease [Ferruginibacter sp.]|uniref:rhomboid family intramembrane serine protease n=1 Tax=Ferruginibacter sp. TaxID=1940288 RepID=UPI001984D7C4|nr:rhomboid family intramembrane serine protease [Ferruginibacter sp.]MBC7626532.1 rhomboid family intramembrane serine protease [Ferruginibacter sp.]
MAFKFNNSLQRDTPIVFNLLIINILAYLAQILVKPFNITEWGALHYIKSSLFYPHQFITNMFLHDPNGLTHILFNMFTLWMFGTILERYLGSKRFLIFYLICGVGAAVCIQLSIPFSADQFAKSPEAIAHGMSTADLVFAYKEQYSAIGASGAIMGIMAAYAYLFPNTELYIMFIPLPLKAKYVIPFFILLDLFMGVRQIAGDNVGHFAHLGGALVGFLLIYYWNKTNRKTFY